jgi:hypothetical protein
LTAILPVESRHHLPAYGYGVPFPGRQPSHHALRAFRAPTAVIGYIALFAVAIQTGIIMIIVIRQALARKTANETSMDAVVDGHGRPPRRGEEGAS